MKILIFNRRLISVITIMTVVCTSGFTTSLTRENAYLVHATQYFPPNGDMIAGAIPVACDGNGQLLDPDRLIAAAQHSLTQWRNTIHWSLNSLAYPHTAHVGITKIDVNRNEYRYVIIEPLTEFDSIIGGYWQDVFTIGGHRLSPHSVIFVCSDDTSYREKIGGFRGQIIPYAGSVRNFVSNWIKEHNAPLLEPNVPKYDGSTLEDKYVRPESQVVEKFGTNPPIIVPSAELSHAVGLDNTTFNESLLGRVQYDVRDLFNHVRYFRTYLEFGANFNRPFDEYCYLIRDNRDVLDRHITRVKTGLTVLLTRYGENGIVLSNLRCWQTFIRICINSLYPNIPQPNQVNPAVLVALMDRN